MTPFIEPTKWSFKPKSVVNVMIGRCANSTSQTNTQVESNGSTRERQGTEVTGARLHKLLGFRSLSWVYEVLHFRCPLQKSPEIAALAPEKLPEFDGTDLLHFQAAIGLNPP